MLVIHELREELLVLLHPVDEQRLKGLVEDESEILNRVGEGCLTKLLIRNRLFADLIEEKLIGWAPGLKD